MKNTPPIIPVYSPDCQVKSWKMLLKQAVSSPQELLRRLALDQHPIAQRISQDTGFNLRVPQPYIDKMQPGNPDDPLLLQVLSVSDELQPHPGYSRDPLAENNAEQPGLLHKYHGRVLLLLASACAVNCRYCFRRHFPYADKVANGESLAQAIHYIESEPSISEVILSGGDPLIVSDGFFTELVERLQTIPHLQRLRIHSRLPVVIPQRITAELCTALAETRLYCSLVLHINHANEIDELLTERLRQLTAARVTLLNQAVLLKNVNDSLQAQILLNQQLFAAGVLPYYLHQLDKVQGAAHFAVTDQEALTLMAQLRDQLPGYLVPRLAREEPGKGAKTLLF